MLSFAQPQFLIAGAALAVPFVLHLLRRQAPVSMRFPTIRFILKGRLPRTGRRRLRDLWLLLLRVLLFACAVLAFARPRWHAPPSDAAAAAQRRDVVVVVVDVSASMAGWQGLDNAKTHLRELISKSPGVALGVVASADRPVMVVPPTTDHASLLEVVEQLRPQPVPGRHEPALAEALALMPPGLPARLHIISDFRESDWALLTPVALPPAVELVLDDVNPNRTDNVAITAARSQTLTGGRVRVLCELRNYGPTEARRDIELRTGQAVTGQTVTVPPNGAARVVLASETPATARGTVQLAPDEYALDDSYAVWLGRRPPLRLLAVVPFADEPDKEQELFFLKKAFAVTADSSDSRFEIEEVEATLFFSLVLDTVDGVLLLGAAGHLQAPGLELLKAYLQAGGTALATPGRAAGHQFLSLKRHGFLAANFRGVTDSQRGYGLGTHVSWIDPDSSLAALFGETEDTDLFFFNIHRYARLDLEPACRAVLKGKDMPLLLEQTIGDGRLFATAFALDPSWSDLPLSNSFLPLVRELMTASASARGRDVLQITCGQSLPVVRNLAGEPAANSTADAQDKPPHTMEPTVVLIGSQPCEVNVDRRESLPAKRSLLGLREQLTGTPGTAVSPSGTAAKVPLEAQAARSLWPWLIATAAALTVAELLAATFLERRENNVTAPSNPPVQPLPAEPPATMT